MRRGERIANLVFLWPVLLFTTVSLSASLVAHAPKGYYFLSMGLLLAGFALLLTAKLPHFRSKRHITFGTKGMTAANRFFYYSGGIFTAIGALVTLGLLAFVLAG